MRAPFPQPPALNRSCHPLCGSCLLCEAPSCLGLVGWHPGFTSRQHQSSHALPQPRCTQTPPPSTVFRFPALHLPQGCAPTHPLPPVSGRQLQPCPLLREQVDSDAQSHKPWVGTRFFSMSLSSSPPSLVVYPSSPLWSSCLPHCPSSFPSFALCTPLNSQNDMFFSLPAGKVSGPSFPSLLRVWK